MKAIIKLLFSLIFLVGLYNNSFAVPYNPPQPKVYDGCGLPNFRTTTHNTYYFDIVNGNDSTGNGTQATPWQHPNAIFHLTNGLGPLLGSTIHAGDVVLLENGNYGVLQPGSSGSATNQINFLTIAADLGQVNVSFSNITIQNITKLYIQGITVHSLGTGSNATDSLISLAEQGSTLGYTTQDIIINETNLYSQADVSTWTTSQWLSNGNNGIMGFQSAPGNMKCVAIENSNIYNIIGGIQILAGNVLLYNNNIYQTGEFAIDACGINGQIQKNLIHDGNSLGAGDVVTGQTTTNCSNWDIFNNFIWKATATGSIYYLPILYDGIINLDSDITKVKIHNNLVITDASLGIGGSSLHSSSLFQNTILQDGTTSSNGNPALWVGSIATGATLPSSNTSAYNNFIPALGNSDQPFYNIGSGVSANNNLLPYNSGGVVITDYNSSSIVETLIGTSGSATNYTQAFSGGVNKVDKSGGYTNQIQSYDPVHFVFNLRAVNGSFLKSMNVGANGYGSVSASILPKPGCFPDGNCPLPLVSQTITFPTLSNSVLGGTAPTPAATASSGLTVSYSSLTSSICTISGTTITMIQTGTCTIQATQAGNTQYATATPVNQSFTISSSGGSVVFTPLSQYYLASNGNDSCDGTTSAIGSSGHCAWLTPNHNVHCGDVIIAAAGTHNQDFATWGTVSNCPSTSGGIDGTGGVYAAILLCGGADLGSSGCKINCATTSVCNGGPVGSGGRNATQACMNVNKNNWAIEGWQCTGTSSTRGFQVDACLTTSTIIHHQIFINDIDYNNAQAFDVDECGYGSAVPGNGADYHAVVGSIGQNAAQDTICLAAFDEVGEANWDSVAGTHIFLSGNFAWNNNTTDNGCGSDEENYMFDTLDAHGYNSKIVFSNNIGYTATRYGFQLFYQGYNASTLTMNIYNNSFYNDGLHTSDFASGDINLNYAAAGSHSTNNWVITIQNNIVYNSHATSPSGGGALYSATIGGLFWSGLTFGGTGNENILKGSATSCLGTSCGGTNDTTVFNGNSLGTQIYTNPNYTNLSDLTTNRLGAPNCTGFTNVAACMGYDATTSTLTIPSIISDLVPTASQAAGKGYQFPSITCVSSGKIFNDYPAYLKGIVYLHWSGSSLTENNGLITKPCNM